MAQEALVDLGVILFRDGHRNHLEVHHVVARRSLMALGAVQGSGRGMAELRNGPCDGAVTLRAVLAEQSEVPVLGPVTCGAIQYHLLRRQAHAPRPRVYFAVWLIDPAQELYGGQAVFRLVIRVAFELPQPDA